MERHIISKYLLGMTIIISTPFSERAERILENMEVSFVVTKRVGA
jgi:hypothetical protein